MCEMSGANVERQTLNQIFSASNRGGGQVKDTWNWPMSCADVRDFPGKWKDNDDNIDGHREHDHHGPPDKLEYEMQGAVMERIAEEASRSESISDHCDRLA